MKVNNITLKEGAGWTAKELHLEGSQYPIKMFESHSLYNDIAIGDDVEIDKSGKYWNVVDPNPSQKSANKGNFGANKGMPSAIKEMAENKNNTIKELAGIKNDAMKVSGAKRDATLIVTTFYPELADAEDKEAQIKAKLQEWYDHYMNYLPF